MCKAQCIYRRIKLLHCVVDSHVDQEHEMIICSRGNDSQMRTFTVEFRLNGKECSLLGLSRSVKELFLYILVLCFLLFISLCSSSCCFDFARVFFDKISVCTENICFMNVVIICCCRGMICVMIGLPFICLLVSAHAQ